MFDIYFTATEMSSSILVCPCCGSFSANSLTNLLSHIRLLHADAPNFAIDCNFQGCRRNFKKFHSFRNHVYAFHSTSGKQLQQTPIDHQDDILHCDLDVDSDDNEQGFENEPLCVGTPSFADFTELIQRAAATWILKVRECHRLPQSTLESIVKDLESFYQVS